MHTLDTNAIIYYLKDDEKAVPVLRDVFAGPAPIYISSITELELLSFSGLTSKEVTQIERLLDTLVIVPVDSRIARIAGTLRREHGLKTADSTIAATALMTNTTLLTRNTRDFKNVPDLSVKKI